MNLFEIYVITGFSSLIFIVFLLYWFFVRKRIVVKIMREYGDQFKIIKTKKLGFSVEEFAFKGHRYVVDLSRSILDNKNNPILHYKADQSEPIVWTGSEKGIDSRVAETIFKAKIFEKIFTSQLDKTMMLLVIGLMVGIVAISVIAIWRISALNSEIAQIMTGGYS